MKVTRLNWWRLCGYGAAADIVVGYLLVTGVPSGSLQGRADVTLLPFAEPFSRSQGETTRYELMRDVAVNVAAGAVLTFGFFAASITRTRAVGMTTVTDLVAEALQAATPYARVADINDLILSTLCALLAVGSAVAVSSLRGMCAERSAL